MQTLPLPYSTSMHLDTVSKEFQMIGPLKEKR